MVNLRNEEFSLRSEPSSQRNSYVTTNDSGRFNPPSQKRTASYDKHYLSHTDTTGGGLGYSYPHKKDFAWNLLFLKQSWGVGLKPAENTANNGTNTSSNSSTRSKENGVKQSTKERTRNSEDNRPPRKASTAPNLELPKLTPNKSTPTSKRSKRRTAGQSRTTLDSIPEDKIVSVLSKPEIKPMRSQRRSKRHRTTSSQASSQKSRMSESRNSGVTSSLLSSDLPSMASESRNGSVSATTMTSQSSYGSRAPSVTSQSTRWDEHEGRPAVEKMFGKQRSRAGVACTIKSDVIEKIKNGDYGRSSETKIEQRAATTSGIPLNNNAFSQRKYQPFTNLSFTIENSANKTRLRSSLYKPTEAMKKPTIFRSNDTISKPHKPFNPKYHSDITRPVMVDSHAHKHPPDGYAPPKWFPAVKKTSGPWTTYKH